MNSQSRDQNWVKKWGWLAIGMLLVVFGILMPIDWYDRIPVNEELPPPPISGASLVRICFILEGVAILLLVSVHRRGFSVGREQLLCLPEKHGNTAAHPLLWLIGITVLGAFLRFYQIHTDLWLDEIATYLDYRDVSPFHVLTAYTASNNHLLHTLEMKASVSLFGVTEWAIRLPTALLGTASVPAVYFLSRIAMKERESLLAALLLAISYHHVFFSQNARGYTGLLFWSLVASLFFLKSITETKSINWWIYGVAMFLAIGTMLHGWFVLAGQVLTFPLIVCLLRRQSVPIAPLGKKLILTWGIISMAGLHLYSSVIPQVYVYINNVYKEASVGAPLFSKANLETLQEGLFPGGSGTVLTLATLAALAGLGLIGLACLRKRLVFTLTLCGPLVTTAAFVIAKGVLVTPRMFLWILPVTFILTMVVFAALQNWASELTKPRFLAARKTSLHIGLNVTLAIPFLLSAYLLPKAYRYPKQPHRESIEFVVNQKGQEGTIIAAYLADWGLRFYGSDYGLEEGESFHVAVSFDEMMRLESELSSQPIWLFTTFPGILKTKDPDLFQHLQNNYEAIREFPAGIGDGNVTVWKRHNGR